MDNLYHRSIAAGIDPRTAERDQWADDLQKFNNREQYADSSQYAAGEGPQEVVSYAARRGA